MYGESFRATNMNMIEDKFHDLRSRAENKLQDSLSNFDNYSLKDIKSLIHEIQVHQVELEMQNDELIRTQYELKKSEMRHEYHYNFVPIGYVNIDEMGYIHTVNNTFCQIVGRNKNEIIRTDINNLILWEDRDVFYHINKDLNSGIDVKNRKIRFICNNKTVVYTELTAKIFEDRNSVDLIIIDKSKIYELEEKIKILEHKLNLT